MDNETEPNEQTARDSKSRAKSDKATEPSANATLASEHSLSTTNIEPGSNVVRLGHPSGTPREYKGARVKDENGLTRQQEAFAKAYGLECLTITEAYRKTYNIGPNTKASTTHRTAWDLSRVPHVAARIKYWEQRRIESNLHSAEKIRTFLVEKLREEATNLQSKPSDRLKAMELLGKVDYVGLFRERSSVETVAPSSASDIKAEIEALLADTGS